MSSVATGPQRLPPRWDLDIARLVPELRAMRGLRARDDLRAAVGGAAAAVPLTLFLAVDTGASPIRALVALGVGGPGAALLSGTRVAAGGPSIAAGAALRALAATHDRGPGPTRASRSRRAAVAAVGDEHLT